MNAYANHPLRALAVRCDEESAFVSTLASVVTQECSRNTPGASGHAWASVFDCEDVSDIPVEVLLTRLVKYGQTSPALLICMTVYVDRLRMVTGLPLTWNNVHRLLLTAFLVAVKTHEDDFYSNEYYGAIVDMSLADMNQAERVFLTEIDWETYIAGDIVSACYDEIVALSKPAQAPASSPPRAEGMEAVSRKLRPRPPQAVRPSGCRPGSAGSTGSLGRRPSPPEGKARPARKHLQGPAALALRMKEVAL